VTETSRDPALASEAPAGFVCLGALPEGIPRAPLPERRELDPVTFAVIGGALFSVCQEMDLTLRNASLSPIISLGKDFSCALFTADGQLVAQACNCPGHVGSMHFAVHACIARFGLAAMADGDVFLLNDPYLGGTHLPDITVVTPIFHAGELVMFAGNRAHHSDVGGSVPGSFPISSEIYEEGIRIPPVRFARAGERIVAVLEILLANVRTPREVAGDLDAPLAANEAGVRGVSRLMARFGCDGVLAAVADYLDHSEQALRASLDLPDGTYVGEDWMDGDGTREDRAHIRAAITVAGGRVLVDFTGTDPQARGPINSVFATTASMVVTALLALTDPTIMPNHGFYRPIWVRAPEGTLVNPLPPAPAVGFPDVCNRIVEVLMQALTPVIPERVIAATSGTTCNAFFGGTRPDTGEPYVWYSINSQGGWGGRHDADGWHNVCFIEANGWDVPVETIEYRYPWRVLAYRIRADSAGAGRFRGGEGNHLELTPLEHDAVFSLNGDRAATRPYGLFGGKPGAGASCTVVRRDGTNERIAPRTMKAQRIVVRQGEVVVIEATSGGGYANPLERDIDLVRRDVLDGVVSPASARRDYGVAIDAETLAVSPAETEARRARMRSAFAALERPAIDRVGYTLGSGG
jgi:N-methylhydantoinase B